MGFFCFFGRGAQRMSAGGGAAAQQQRGPGGRARMPLASDSNELDAIISPAVSRPLSAAVGVVRRRNALDLTRAADNDHASSPRGGQRPSSGSLQAALQALSRGVGQFSFTKQGRGRGSLDSRDSRRASGDVRRSLEAGHHGQTVPAQFEPVVTMSPQLMSPMVLTERGHTPIADGGRLADLVPAPANNTSTCEAAEAPWRARTLSILDSHPQAPLERRAQSTCVQEPAGDGACAAGVALAASSRFTRVSSGVAPRRDAAQPRASQGALSPSGADVPTAVALAQVRDALLRQLPNRVIDDDEQQLPSDAVDNNGAAEADDGGDSFIWHAEQRDSASQPLPSVGAASGATSSRPGSLYAPPPRAASSSAAALHHSHSAPLPARLVAAALQPLQPLPAGFVVAPAQDGGDGGDSARLALPPCSGISEALPPAHARSSRGPVGPHSAGSDAAAAAAVGSPRSSVVPRPAQPRSSSLAWPAALA